VPPKTAKNEVKQTIERSERRTVTGVVTADKMDKTVKVRVERLVQHPQFSKTLRKHYDCYAHDEKREAKLGDKVELMESRPISKLKHWRLVRVVEKAIAGSMVEDARHAARPSAKSADAAPAPKPAPKTT